LAVWIGNAVLHFWISCFPDSRSDDETDKDYRNENGEQYFHDQASLSKVTKIYITASGNYAHNDKPNEEAITFTCQVPVMASIMFRQPDPPEE
jgi:hypothetical protein